MTFLRFLQGRPDRVIAAGRIVLASTSLLALELHPSEPASQSGRTLVLVAGYAGYALLLAIATWRSNKPSRHEPLLTHVLDLTVLCLLMYLTEGPTSPFLSNFVFVLTCAAVRWGWGGTLWTALATLAAFTGLSVYGAEVAHDPRFELNRSIIRALHLGIVAVSIAYVAAHERRLRGQIARLTEWSRFTPREAAAAIREGLACTANTLRAPRMLMLWEEAGEPRLHLAFWSADEFRWTQDPADADAFRSSLSDQLSGRSFLCHDAGEGGPVRLHTSPGESQLWSGVAIHPQLRERFAIGSVLGLALRGENLAGRLFALDIPAMSTDDLVVGEIVAQRLAERLDLLHLVQRLRETGATEAQMSLARDLHDGLLQSLTAMSLQLETVRRQLITDPVSARDRLREIQRVMSAEQRDLRVLVRQFRPTPEAEAPPPALAARLEELSHRIERHWGLRIELNRAGLTTDDLETRIPATLTQDIYLLLHEALVNAARHSGASSAHVTIGIEDDRLRITVADDGVGFRFRGRHDHATLVALNLGPVSLLERTAARGGSLSIDSSDSGASLSITLPLSLVAGSAD
jgi:signal transduction histidine kinase